jgi:hypothetical protein
MDTSKIKVKVGQHWVDSSNSNSEFVILKVKNNEADIVTNGHTGSATLTKDGYPTWHHSWKLKIAIGQIWYMKTSVTDSEYTITSIDWSGVVYGTLNDKLTKTITPQHKLFFTLPGIMAELWEFKNDEDIIAEAMKTVVVIEGMNCDRCNSYNTFVESNMPDGKYRCYSCRH